tara:strand:- start:105 stop:395 length:291 start_codon:yes stop_codon:yes gene_type:complete
MKFYTNKDLQGTENLQGTATIKLNEDISGKFSGETIEKGSEVVVAGTQYDTLMSVIDDGNCEWDLIVEQDQGTNRDCFTLSYTEDKTNFSLESINC